MSDRNQRQARMKAWVLDCFGAGNLGRRERAMRLLEEAIEVAQAEAIPAEEVARLVQHVYAKPAGDPAQELGGVGVCLLGYAEALGVSADEAEQRELDRICSKTVEHFRRRHQAKAERGIALPSNK